MRMPMNTWTTHDHDDPTLVDIIRELVGHTEGWEPDYSRAIDIPGVEPGKRYRFIADGQSILVFERG